MQTLNAQHISSVAGGIIATTLPGDFPIIDFPRPWHPHPPFVTPLPFPLPQVPVAAPAAQITR